MRTLSLLLASASLLAQAPNPGREQYETSCARCHGGDAAGGESGPSILARVSADSDVGLATFLRAGRPANGMPAFAFPDPRMTPLVTYLRTLNPIPRNNAPAVTRRRVTLADGKTLEGRVLNEGMTDLQLQGDDRKIHLLRKTANDRFREVTSQRDWPTYNGEPGGNRFSPLTQIDKTNVGKLTLKWVFPMANVNTVENTPLVVEGVMYVSSANEVWALDAGTGRQVWRYQRPRTRGISGNAALGFNRGVAWREDRIFLLTDHAHLLSLNRFNGELLWETELADYKQNYNGTSAPLVVGNLVITGHAGGDEGVRGFVAAYDAQTGQEVWRFYTVPKAGEPGSETWKGNTLEHAAGATWMTGTYDPQLDLVYWPVGNPGSDFYGDDREGDNLYTDSVVALEAKTGRMRWYYQFTPHDIHDWDAQEPPVLIDTVWQGQPRKLLIQANRNGFFYVLDRTNGEFLLGKQFLKKLNWAEGIGKDGRPILRNLPVEANGDIYVCPGFQGGTNWFSTSFNPSTGLYYFNVLERCNIFSKRKMEWEPGKGFMGGTARPAPGESYEKSLRAINIQNGETAWEIPQVTTPATSSAGVISTAGGVVLFGENSGSFMAADASSGKVLWQLPTNQIWKASPMTYMFDNKQFIAIAVGQSIMTFGLPD